MIWKHLVIKNFHLTSEFSIYGGDQDSKAKIEVKFKIYENQYSQRLWVKYTEATLPPCEQRQPTATAHSEMTGSEKMCFSHFENVLFRKTVFFFKLINGWFRKTMFFFK